MSVGLRAEKFNIVSNDHGRSQKCNFSILVRKYSFWGNLVPVFDRKYPFWANLIPIFKTVCLKLNFILRLFSVSRFQLWTFTFFRKWKRNLKIGWRHKLASSLSFKFYFLSIAVKTYAEANIKVFWSCPILLDILTFGKIFCRWLYTKFKYPEFSGGVHFFSFRLEIPFLDNFSPKYQIYQFKLKFDTYNQFHNILRLSDVLPKFLFTTSETMGDY